MLAVAYLALYGGMKGYFYPKKFSSEDIPLEYPYLYRALKIKNNDRQQFSMLC